MSVLELRQCETTRMDLQSKRWHIRSHRVLINFLIKKNHAFFLSNQKKKKNPLYKNASDAEIFEDLAVKNEIGDGLYVLGTSVFSIKEGKLNQIR